MSYGAGKIEQLPSGRWRLRVPDGSGGYVTIGTYDTHDEADRMRTAALIARERVVAYDTVAAYGDRVIATWERAGKRSSGADASRWLSWVVKRATWAQEPVGYVTRSMVREWATGLLDATTAHGKPASEQTIKHALVLVRSVFAEAVRDELIAVNPAADVEAPTRNQPKREHWDALSDLEIEHAIGCADLRADQRAAIALACLTGVRQGELAALEWADVRDLDGASPHLMVRRSWGTPPKNGRTRRVDLMPRAAAVLQSMRPTGDARGNVWGTDHARGYDWGWADTADRSRGVTWLGVRRRLGITRDVTWHHLRDTCASHLLTGTWGRAWTIAEVAALLGHSSTWVTERYGRLLPGALAAAAAATDRPRGPGESSTWAGSFAGGVRIERTTFGSGGPRRTPDFSGDRDARGRFVAGEVLRIVAAGEPLAESLIGELVASVLARADVRVAQQLAAGEGPRVMLAVRLAEMVGVDAAVARDESESA